MLDIPGELCGQFQAQTAAGILWFQPQTALLAVITEQFCSDSLSQFWCIFSPYLDDGSAFVMLVQPHE